MKRKSILSLNDFELDKAVIIAGTQYDRKRVLNDKIIAKMKKDFHKGMSPKDIAKKYGYNYRLVRYNIDMDYRARRIAQSPGKHTGIDVCDAANRVAYKRSLIKNSFFGYNKFVKEGYWHEYL